MANLIQIKRGLKADLPNLKVGEFGLATDTKEVFIGTPTGNKLVNSGGDVDLSNYYDKNETNTLLDYKVDKVSGKGLSSNDFTNNLKEKLEGIDFKGYAHDITYDEINHILKVPMTDEEMLVVDLPIEMLVKNIELNDDNDLVITFENGNTTTVPIGVFLQGVVREVNGKKPNALGVINLSVDDIPNLRALLADKADKTDLSQVYGGKNLASPDLTGKEYLGDGVYVLDTVNDFTLTYNVYNGIFTKSGTYSANEYDISFTHLNIQETTTSIVLTSLVAGLNFIIYNDDYTIYEGIVNEARTLPSVSILRIYGINAYETFSFKLQIEKGSTATPYTLPLWITPEYLEKEPITTTLGVVSNENSLEVNKNNFYNSSHKNLTFVIGGTFNAFTFTIPISEYESKFNTGSFSFVGVFNPDTPAYYIIQVTPNITSNRVRISKYGAGSGTLQVKVIAS